MDVKEENNLRARKKWSERLELINDIWIHLQRNNSEDLAVWLRPKQDDQIEPMKLDCFFCNCGRKALVAWWNNKFGEALILNFNLSYI